MDDRIKLGMDSADHQNRYERRGRLTGGLVKQAEPSVGKTGFKMEMIMMMIRTNLVPSLVF